MLESGRSLSPGASQSSLDPIDLTWRDSAGFLRDPVPVRNHSQK